MIAPGFSGRPCVWGALWWHVASVCDLWSRVVRVARIVVGVVCVQVQFEVLGELLFRFATGCDSVRTAVTCDVCGASGG